MMSLQSLLCYMIKDYFLTCSHYFVRLFFGNLTIFERKEYIFSYSFNKSQYRFVPKMGLVSGKYQAGRY